jgi:hypothetical protein
MLDTIEFMRKARDSNSEALAGGSFQDCCSTIVPAFLLSDAHNGGKESDVPREFIKPDASRYFYLTLRTVFQAVNEFQSAPCRVYGTDFYID